MDSLENTVCKRLHVKQSTNPALNSLKAYRLCSGTWVSTGRIQILPPSLHIYDDLLFPSPPSPPRPRSTEQDAEPEPLHVPGPVQSWIQVLAHEPLQRAADTTSLTLPLATVPPNNHNSLPRWLLHSASPSPAPGTIPLLIFPHACLLYLLHSSPGESSP